MPMKRKRICTPYRTALSDGRDGATHEEIAAVLGVTRERVRQIEREALRKLRLAYENLMRVKQVRYNWEPGEED
jgi:DNA-directed RNA polymerase sigma subunit (sigma70/sigma32)